MAALEATLLLALAAGATPDAAPPGVTTGATPGAATADSPSAPSRVVVVIGHNGGAPDPRPALRFADDDAARLFSALLPSSTRAFLLATFDKETARAYPDLTDVAREPSRDNLARVLGEAFWLVRQEKSAGKDTELVFAFAGHGDVTDAGEGFVVLSDGTFSRSELLTQVVEASPADINHVVIDACSSYFMVQSRGGAHSDAGEGSEGADKDTATDAATAPRAPTSGAVPLSPKLLDVIQGGVSDAARARTGVLLSTSTAAEVHESSELGSGVFSYLLRSALMGASDHNRDGRVEYGEAAAFITLASSAQDNPRARLSVFARAPQQRPHAALLDLSRTGATHFLAVERGSPVHVRVLDARGVPYAELFSSGDPVLVALLGDPFFIVQKGDEEAVLVARKAGAVSLSSLQFEDSERTRGASPAVAGLFSAPFSSAYLDGFVAASELPKPRAGAVWQVPYVEGAEPPFRIPVGAIGFVTLGGAGALALGAGAAVVGNQLAFSRLSDGYAATGVLDPALSLEVERWRTAATALSVTALAVGLLGGGVALWSTQLDDGTLEVR